MRVLEEAVGMQERGHQIYLAVPPFSQLARQAQKKGVPILPVKMSLWRWAFLVHQFLKIYDAYRIEIVNTHGSLDSWTASIAGRLSKCSPVVIRSRHKSTPVTPTFRHRWLYGKLSQAVIATGESVRQGLIEKTGVLPSRIISIPTGVDLTKFFPRKPDPLLKQKIGFGKNDHVVGTIAFLRDYKGVDVFLQAAALVIREKEQVKFLIVGDGPERENLEVLREKLGLSKHVYFLGFQENIPEILSIMDMVVLCSVRHEGVPQVLTQALAMEKAVVATNVGSISELVRDGVTGMLVSPQNPRELSSRLLSLIEDERLRECLGQEGRKLIVDVYSRKMMLDKMEAWYREQLFWKSGGQGEMEKDLP